MSRRRFFVPEIRRGTAELTGRDAEHLVRVLRAEVGQVYEISDNRELYLAEVETARKSQVVFRVLEKLESEPARARVTLVAALFKFDRFEWLVEKATELGVTAIQPFEAERTEKGLGRASEARRARWERIALEASQQARRAHLPEIRATVSFRVALGSSAGAKIFLDEDPAARPMLEYPQQMLQDVALMIGPEGGWTDGERQQARAEGWQACSLGRTILRAETAGIAALAIVQAAAGMTAT